MAVTFKEYIQAEVECYIENVEDERACSLSDSQVAKLIGIMADKLSNDEWLSQQIMECISDEYDNSIGEVL